MEEALKFAEKMDRVINNVVRKVMSTIENFKRLVSTIRGFDIGDIIDDFINAIRNLPREVFDLRKIAKRISKVLDEYEALPPVFYQIKDFVRKVTGLFNDVKYDVINLYNVNICQFDCVKLF